MIDSNAVPDIVNKIAAALNLKVFSFCGSHLALNSLREDADQASNVELSSPGHLRMITFSSYEDLLYHILHSKNIHICRAHSIDHPLRDDWIKLANPFYHLSPEEAAVKADLENGNG